MSIDAAPTAPVATSASVSRPVVVVAIGGSAALGLGAFWLSFTSLTNLATRAGIAETQAWVWPLIVDGLIVVATVSVYALSPHGLRATWFGWLLLYGATAVSVAGNGVHALFGDPTMPAPVRVAVAAVPPIVLLAVTHLTVELIRRTRPASAEPAPARHEEPAAAVGIPEPEPTAAETVPPVRLEASRLRALGWSDRRIARAVEVHPSTVGRWLRTDPTDVPRAADSAHGRAERKDPESGAEEG